MPSPTDGAPRYVTVSEVEDFLRCEWRWYAKWVLNRVPRKYSDALILGKAVHKILEAYFLGATLEGQWSYEVARIRAQIRTADPAEAIALAKAAKQLEALKGKLLAFQPQHVGNTLEVEKPFVVELGGGWRFRGRPDRVVEYKRRVWHMQHKTLRKGVPIPVFVAKMARSMHETLYGAQLRRRFPDWDYGGTIANVIVKHPDAADAQLLIPVTDWDMARSESRFRSLVERMKVAEKMGRSLGINALIDNPTLDSGQFGNSLDGYYPVLSGKASLEDDALFMAREETYGEDD